MKQIIHQVAGWLGIAMIIFVVIFAYLKRIKKTEDNTFKP
jgi:hypothetical protein